MDLYLVDGTYELFRAHFGAPKRAAPDGSPAGAVAGLIRTLALLLRESSPAYVACAFDNPIESFRNDLFDGYKTGEGVPEELAAQFELAERASESLGITTWRMEEFEADDAIATAVARWKDEPTLDCVVICSVDKDLMSLVEGCRVVVWDRRRDITYAEPDVVERFGVHPSSIPDYLALVGDAADGIPGVPRWGAKGSAILLAEYGCIDSIPDSELEWSVAARGAKGMAKNLADARERARLYKRLATLRIDVPLAESLDDLLWRGARREEYLALCGELGLERLGDAPSRWRRARDA